MTLIESRIRECFWQFGLTLPISEDYKTKMNAVFGEDITKQIPALLQTIAGICIKNPDDFAGYLEYFNQAYDYMRGYSDNLPSVTLDGKEYQEFMQDQLKKARDAK